MQKALLDKIVQLYNKSDCPVIVTKCDYSLILANDVFDKDSVRDVIKLAKANVGEEKFGSFNFDFQNSAFVETISEGEETVRVIHVVKRLIKEDTNPTLRSAAAEIQYRNAMQRLFFTINKHEKALGKDFDKIESDAYNVLELMTNSCERYKVDAGLREKTDSYFEVIKTVQSVLTQLDLATQISGIKVVFNTDITGDSVIKCDKENFGNAIVKLTRGLCRFATDDVIRVNAEYEIGRIKFSFTVKSNEVTKWLEKNMTDDDLFSAVREAEKLHDGVLLTDAVNELKSEGIVTDIEVKNEETSFVLHIDFENENVTSLNCDTLSYIGNPFSLLTILFFNFNDSAEEE